LRCEQCDQNDDRERHNEFAEARTYPSTAYIT
jgi:hypothetical protein